MEIKLSNTMTREKEIFKPIKENNVNIYTCGLTVYNFAHIGNLRAYVFADTLKRMFLFNGYNVKHIINITDVGHLSDDADSGEDKLEKGARREKKTVWEISQYYTKEFIKDLKELNIIIPEIMPKATEHISEMIDMIKILQEKGFTYEGGGNIYFNTSKLSDYGKLARLKLAEDKLKSRVEKDKFKKNIFDFVLWFTNYKYKNHSMLWDSPWGKGFPGWHIECSAMSSKYLGNYFDIHTGGIDHIPVHHTNEIAQSEAAFGEKWVNYWLHSDFLIINETEKMSKSKDNFLRLITLINKGFTAQDYRYYLLGAHYKKNLEFSFEKLKSAKNTILKLKNKIIEFRKDSQEINKEFINKYIVKFKKEINDDLNTPRALAVLWELINDNKINGRTKIIIISEFDKILGLNILKVEEKTIPDEIIKLKNKRDKAREEKNWELSDELRDEIIGMGYEILDSKEGSVVRKLS